jgi:hypothetical protein
MFIPLFLPRYVDTSESQEVFAGLYYNNDDEDLDGEEESAEVMQI